MRSAVLPACALLSAALLLTSCAGDDAADSATDGAAATESLVVTDTDAADAEDPSPAADSPAGLAISADAVPGLDLEAVSQEDIDQLTASDAELIQRMTVEPPACTRVHQAPVDQDTPPGDVSIKVGTIGDQQVRLYVFADPSFVEELPILSGECSDSTISYSPQDGGEPLRVTVTSTELDAEPPSGVTSFAPVRQSSVADRGGETRESSTVSVSGVFGGTGVLVSLVADTPESPESAVEDALGIFAAQTEKIRAAE